MSCAEASHPSQPHVLMPSIRDQLHLFSTCEACVKTGLLFIRTIFAVSCHVVMVYPMVNSTNNVLRSLSVH
jgi:hypothetical protein